MDPNQTSDMKFSSGFPLAAENQQNQPRLLLASLFLPVTIGQGRPAQSAVNVSNQLGSASQSATAESRPGIFATTSPPLSPASAPASSRQPPTPSSPYYAPVSSVLSSPSSVAALAHQYHSLYHSAHSPHHHTMSYQHHLHQHRALLSATGGTNSALSSESIAATAPPSRYHFQSETNPERLPPINNNHDATMANAASTRGDGTHHPPSRSRGAYLSSRSSEHGVLRSPVAGTKSRGRERRSSANRAMVIGPPPPPPSAALSSGKGANLHHAHGDTSALGSGSQENHADVSWPPLEPSMLGNIGLHKAIESVHGRLGEHLWIGTLGVKMDGVLDEHRAMIRDRLVAYRSVPVFVGDEAAIGHYHQFCKEILWPTMHYILPEYPKKNFNETKAWEHYVEVNRQFAATLVATYRPGDIIWVHDYHLFLVPSMVRKELPNAPIGFFLHIPFPSSEVFRCLPVRKELLEGPLGADIIGFQTYPFARHFLQTVSRILGYEITPKGVMLENNAVVVGIFPIGIDTDALNVKRRLPEVQEMVKILREKYAGKKVIVGRDKLDPVKGVRQKLLAFELFLNTYTEWQGTAVLVQVALSTTDHPELQRQVSDIIRRINSKFGKFDYTPVVYLYQDISFSHYLALLTMADACLITSIRDGMNLTSHEYIVCQEQSHNPLIISEFTGTYGSFGAAIRINPFNYKEVAGAINEALHMSDEQRVRTHGELYRHVTSNTASFWATSFVTELMKVSSSTQRRFSLHIPHLSLTPLMPIYTQAIQRVFILNYDGVLVPYEKTPAVVSPTLWMEKVVSRLTKDSRNKVYVLSGRTKDELIKRLPEDTSNVGLCVEHGCFIRHPDSTGWHDLIGDVDSSWRNKVMEIFEYYTERTPGSLIEKKDLSIVWHYRMADVNFGEWQAKECQNHIADALEKIYPIHAIMGKKNVEVRPRTASKCHAVKYILNKYEDVSFVCYIGDERSDEEVFEYLNTAQTYNPSRCYLTCTIGSKKSKANYFVTGVAEVLQILGVLAS